METRLRFSAPSSTAAKDAPQMGVSRIAYFSEEGSIMKQRTNYGDTTGCALLFIAGGAMFVGGLIYAAVHFA